MRKTKFIMFLMMALFAISSCTDENVEESTLSLSEEEALDLPKQSSEQFISVTTNESSWTSFVNVDWIQIEQDLNSLTLIVKENTGVTERKADLVVIAGKAVCKLSLTQSASAVELELSKEEEEIDQWGGNINVDVNTNSQRWRVDIQSGAEEWVSVLPKLGASQFIVTVSENTEKAAREAVITVVDENSKKAKEFIVRQKGILYYNLPLLEPMLTGSVITEYEEKNKGYRLLDTTFLNNNVIAYKTKNPLVPYVQYFMGDNYAEQVVMLISDQDFFVDQDFFKMFEKSGFAYVSSDEKSKKYSKKVTVEQQPFVVTAEIYKSAPNGFAGIVYVDITPAEPSGMTTYKDLLLGFTEFDGISKATIDAWEAKNNGQYNSAMSSETPDMNGNITYTYSAPAPYYFRTYIFKKDNKFDCSWLLFRDIPKFYFEFDGKYYMIEAFYDKLVENGFVVDGTDAYGFDCFNNKTKKIRLEIKVSPFKGFGTGDPLVEVYIRPLASATKTQVKPSLYRSEEFLETTLRIINK